MVVLMSDHKFFNTLPTRKWNLIPLSGARCSDLQLAIDDRKEKNNSSFTVEKPGKHI